MRLRALSIGFVVWITGVMPADASEYRVVSGVDSNPYRLADPGNGQAIFNAVSADQDLSKYIGKNNRMFLDVSGDGVLYQGDYKDASEWAVRARVGFKSKHRSPEVFHFRTRLQVEGELERDTYVERSTGTVATFGGEDIGDRFDTNTVRFRSVIDAKPLSWLRSILDISAERVNYVEDYASLGITELDYEQGTAVAELKFRLSEAVTLSMSTPVSVRRYLNREARDLDGNLIPGSGLEYTYYGADAGLVFKPSRALRLSLKGSYELREDNESGYYDRTRLTGAMNMSYAFGQNSLRLRAIYSSRELREDAPPAPTDPTQYGRTREGYTTSFVYERRFGYQRLPTFIFLEARYRSYDNSDPIYAYDRGMAVVGISIHD
jgi:hypothetical protein